MAPMRTEARGEREVESGGAGSQETPVSTVSVSTMAPAKAWSSNPKRLMSNILRLIVIVLTLLATIVMGVAKETLIFRVSAYSSVEYVVKSTYNSSFVYFIVKNAVSCLYSAVSVGVTFTNQNNASIDLLLCIADLVFTILLFTGNASAAAIEIVAQKGNSRFGWDKICNFTSKLCDRLTASIVLSTVASVVFAMVIVLSMISFQKKSR